MVKRQISMGGRQTSMGDARMQKHFMGNYVIPSPKSSEDQKKKKKGKGLRRKIQSFCPRNRVQIKKSLDRNLGLYSARICGIYF